TNWAGTAAGHRPTICICIAISIATRAIARTEVSEAERRINDKIPTGVVRAKLETHLHAMDNQPAVHLLALSVKDLIGYRMVHIECVLANYCDKISVLISSHVLCTRNVELDQSRIHSRLNVEVVF